MENYFFETYKTYSNTDLIKILDNSDDYQETAVDAAKKEIESRNLSQEEIEKAKIELLKLKLTGDKKTEKIEKIKNEASSQLTKLFNLIYPIKDKEIKDVQLINLICMILGGIFLFQFLKNLRYWFLCFTDIFNWTIGEIIQTWMPFFALPIGVILFAKRKQKGWFLLCAYLTFIVFTNIYSLIFNLNYKSSSIDNFFNIITPGMIIGLIIFYGGILYTISTNRIRKFYNIDNQKLIFTILIFSVITTYQWRDLLI